MNDEFYNDFDEGRDIEKLSEAEENEFRDIEGIESDEEYASEENISGAAGDGPFDQSQVSSPENPLYDPFTGERIPYGYSLRDWEKKKRAAKKKQAGIRALMERERQSHEAEEERLKQLEKEEEYAREQNERAERAYEEIKDALAGQGRENIVYNDLPQKAALDDPKGEAKEASFFEERLEEEKRYGSTAAAAPTGRYEAEKSEYAGHQPSKDEVAGSDERDTDAPIKARESRSDDYPKEDGNRGIFTEGPDFQKETVRDVRGDVSVSGAELTETAEGKYIGSKKNGSESAEDALTRKLFKELCGFDSSKAYQMPDAFNDGMSDTTYHAGVNAKSQLGDTVASRADSVVMAFATALDGDTRGTYGSDSDDVSKYMVSSRDAVNVKKDDVQHPVRIYKDIHIEKDIHIDKNMNIQNGMDKTKPSEGSIKAKSPDGESASQILNERKKEEFIASKRFENYSSGNKDRADKAGSQKSHEVQRLKDSEKSKPDVTKKTMAIKDDNDLFDKSKIPYAQGTVTQVMLDRTSAINDVMGSETGKTGNVLNHSAQERVFTVKSIIQAKRNENGNYRSAVYEPKNYGYRSGTSGYSDEEKRRFLKDIEDVLSLDKNGEDAGSPIDKNKYPSFIESTGSDRITKAKTRDFQAARDGIEALGVTTANNIKTADDSDENDVKKGINIVNRKLDDIRLLLGRSGLIAASNLDTAMGERQALLMEKLSHADIDANTLSVFVDRKERLKHFRKTLTQEGLYGPADKKAIKKACRDEKNALIKDLQKKGLSRYEAKDIIKKGLGGESVLDNLMTAMEARNELLDKASKDRNLFTDEELLFIRSKEFFNAARSSRQISALTKKYFDRSGNTFLKELNPGASYLKAVSAREGTGKLLPNVMGRRGLFGKVEAIIDPHSYNLNINLTREKLHNRNHIKLERVIKKDPDCFTRGQRAVLKLQKDAEKHSSYIERRKIYNRNRYSIKNAMRVGFHYFVRLESDTTVGLNQILSVKRGTEAAYSLLKLGLKSTWTAALPVRFIARKTGVTKRAAEAADRAKEGIRITLGAKKTSIAKKAKDTKTVRGIRRADTAIKTSKPVVGVSSKLSSAKKIKQKTGTRIRDIRARRHSRIMNNPIGRIFAAPFHAAGFISKTYNRIKEIFVTIGHWVILAVGVTVVLWLVLLYMAGLFMSFGKSIDITGRYVIMADQELIEKWINRYLSKDDEKYDEAVSHAEDDPIDPHAWGGVKLYHYGVYEAASTTYFNRNYTSCYYHEKGKTKKNKAKNGFHIIYIDRDGNTIGSNTTNIKDVLSVSTVMAGNDWYSHQADVEGLMDQMYTILNPEAAYVESEIYACTNGCDTYPRKHTDGDPANGNNWYSGSSSAYECSDAGIYTEYERLLDEGVRFYPDDTFTYSSRQFYERLVPQTEGGCNPTAKFSFERVKVSDGHYSRYITSEDGSEHPDHSSWVSSEYRYQLKDIEYSNKCGGKTYCYEFDPEGYYYRNTETEPYTYAPLYNDDPERISEVNGAGFYGSYSKDYSSTIPHTAIKCCYGHKDLNIYITVLTKDDLIEANGGSIEYRVPLHFSHETGEVTEWETKRTESIYSYTQGSGNLRELTQAFYESGGFNDPENTRIIDQIYGEDWYDLYGVNVYGGAAIPDTLSRKSSVNHLNYTILGDVSELRKTLVQTAYSQVGRIPYYWGGKATSKDIYANHFGSAVKPDYKGRRKKGLDCGGFVQLMFCIASGAELHEVGGSTSTFVPSLGLERVSYSDLQPGDIGMENLPGAETNHIGIYAGDGMWIHCQGAPTNTVVYNNSNCFRYYYSLGK